MPVVVSTPMRVESRSRETAWRFGVIVVVTVFVTSLARSLRSSASSDACQKNMYGLIVVPKIATSISVKSRVHDSCGTKVAAATSPQGMWTLNAAPT